MSKITENKKNILIFLTMVIVMALICLILYKPFSNYLNDPAILKENLAEFGNWGKLMLIFAMTIQVIFVFLPGEIIEVAAGFCYGTIPGLIICLTGSIIGSIFIYWFIEKFGLNFVKKFFDLKKFHEVAFLKKEKNLELIIFIIFFIPGTPKDLLTYIAPFTGIKLKTFLLLTTFARIPSVVTSTIGGNALSNQNYRFTILVFVITGLISLIGLICYNFYIKKKNL